LRDAVAALRTQHRLLRLVEALHTPAPVDHDQAETQDVASASAACMQPN
jgi:hypothetical protein